MGFKDLARSAAKGAAKKIQEKQEEVEKYKERFDRLDDDELVYRFRKATNNTQRIALMKLMQERGISSDQY